MTTVGGSEENLLGTEMLIALASGDRQQIDERMRSLLAVKSSIGFINVIHKRMWELLDDPQRAIAELKQMAADPRAQSAIIQGAIIPQWAAALGDPEFALVGWSKLPMPVQRGYAIALWRPVYKNMRKLDGFKDLVRQMGLADYWRKTSHWADDCHPVGDNDFECE